MRRILFPVLLILIISSCLNRSITTEEDENTLPIIETNYPILVDVSKTYPAKELYIQDLAKIKYVPLQTNDDILFSLNNRSYPPILTNSGVFFNSGDGDHFLFFDYSGKFKNSVGRRGKGPGEYTDARYACGDDTNKELYILNNNRIFVYGYNGKFKRQFDVGKACRAIGFYAEDTLIMPKSVNKTEAPFALYSSRDGSVLKSILNPYTEPVMLLMLNKRMAVISDRMRTSGDEFILKDVSTDTISALNRKTGVCYPKYVKLPSNLQREPDMRSYIDYGFETTYYSFLVSYDFNYNLTSYVTDKSTGEIFRGIPQNKDMRNYRMQPMLFYRGQGKTLVYIFEAIQLIEMHEKGELSGELEKIADGLDENANPVMMIMELI